jgi:signal transduction histidine kinase/ActR/RegA family two-component response regulator
MSKVIEAFDHLESGMVLYGPDDRLIFCNKRFRELYSSVADMLVPGAPYADITREFYLRTTHDEAGAEAYLQKRLDQHRHPTGLDSEYFIAPDRWVLISDRRTADGGVIGFRLDITERKHAEAAKAKLEEQLRQSQKLETVGTLAAGIAHDFNNILTAIIGNVQMAIEDIPADHQAQENLGEIRRAGHRARDLVRQILAFSQQHAPERHVVRLADIVEEAVRMLRATLPAGIELAVDVAAPDARIEADRAQIMQVLVNLCTNAWHAIGSKVGRIDIIIETIDVSSATNGDAAGMAPGRYAKLSVRDTGSGMEEAVLQRIFDPFFTTKAPGEGTGLGLAVVHGIVSGHGGTIQVASQPGHGTTFTLYFPTVQQAPISEDAPAGIAPRGQAQHILYLDDDELLVLLIEKLLERLGYRVTAHTDAARALADVENQRDIALVVTDYNMPGKSGLDFAADIRRVRPDMPIVLTSGYVTDDLRTEAAALGIRAVLYKPNTMDELASAIHRILVDEGLADQPD